MERPPDDDSHHARARQRAGRFRNRPRRDVQQQWQRDATNLIDEIVGTARCIDAAWHRDGLRIARTAARWTLLRALESWGGCLSIPDLALALRISRQSAREAVLRAVRDGQVELLPHPHDRRALQVALTSTARATLASARAGERTWVITLLNGFDEPTMRRTARVLNAIRQRLLRDERARGR